MSNHEVLVVQIEQVSKHPNADALELLKLSGYDYTIISRLGEFKVGELGVYIEPDYKLSTLREEFKFLHDGKRDIIRITAKRLRGIWSEGLLIKAKEHHKLGDNVIEEYGITKYEPPPQRGCSFGAEGADLKSGLQEKAPEIVGVESIPVYGVENYKKYSNLILPDEHVWYSTKIHGTSARFVWHDDRMFCGSRTTWKQKPGIPKSKVNEFTGETIEWTTPASSWWKVLEYNPWIEEWCKNNPELIVYGEVYGSTVQGTKFHYGYQNETLGFRVFDVWENNKWVDFGKLISDSKYSDLKIVPVLYSGIHSKELLKELAEKNEDSLENCGENHIREGIVIRSKLGKVTLKYVSNSYLTRS